MLDRRVNEGSNRRSIGLTGLTEFLIQLSQALHDLLASFGQHGVGHAGYCRRVETFSRRESTDAATGREDSVQFDRHPSVCPSRPCGVGDNKSTTRRRTGSNEDVPTPTLATSYPTSHHSSTLLTALRRQCCVRVKDDGPSGGCPVVCQCCCSTPKRTHQHINTTKHDDTIEKRTTNTIHHTALISWFRISRGSIDVLYTSIPIVGSYVWVHRNVLILVHRVHIDTHGLVVITLILTPCFGNLHALSMYDTSISNRLLISRRPHGQMASVCIF